MGRRLLFVLIVDAYRHLDPAAPDPEQPWRRGPL
jgi:hypothetical protein